MPDISNPGSSQVSGGRTSGPGVTGGEASAIISGPYEIGVRNPTTGIVSVYPAGNVRIGPGGQIITSGSPDTRQTDLTATTNIQQGNQLAQTIQPTQPTQNYAANLVSSGYSAAITNTGALYPTTNPNFYPQGFQKGVGTFNSSIPSDVTTVSVGNRYYNLHTSGSDTSTAISQSAPSKTITAPSYSTLNISLPYQTRGTGTYNPNTKEYEAPISVVEYKAPNYAASFSETVGKAASIPIEFLGKVSSDISETYRAGLINLGMKDKIVKGQTFGLIPQDVTVMPANTRTEIAPKFMTSDTLSTFSPTTIGNAAGLAAVAPAFVGTAGEVLFGTTALGGLAKIGGGNTAEGLTQFATSAPFVLAPPAIKFLDKMTGTAVGLTETTGKIAGKEASAIIGEPLSVENFVTNEGKIISKVTYPIAVAAREESPFRYVMVTKQTLAPIKRLLGISPEVVYSGNPFTDSAGYQKALKMLTGTKVEGSGFFGKSLSKSEAKDILIFQQPSYKPVIGGFIAESYTGIGENNIIGIEGKYSYPSKIINLGDIKTKAFTPFEQVIDTTGTSLPGGKNGVEFYKSSNKYEKQFLSKEGNPFQKLSQAGKTAKTFTTLSEVSPIGDVDLYFKNRAGISLVRPSTLYSDISLSRESMPSGRLGKSILSTSKTYVEKSAKEPLTITYDSGIRTTNLPPFPTGAKIDYFKPGAGKSLISDLKDIYGREFKSPVIKNVPNKVEFTAKQAKDIFNDLKKVYGTNEPSVGFGERMGKSIENVKNKIAKFIPKLPEKESVKTVSVEEIIGKSKSAEIPTVGLSTMTSSVEVSKSNQNIDSGLDLQGERIKTIISPSFRFNERSGEKQESSVLQDNSQMSLSVQVQQPVQRGKTPVINTTVSRNETILVPVPTPTVQFPISLPKSKRNPLVLRKRRPKSLFIVESRRNKKWFPIGKATSEFGAIRKGAYFTKTSLAASFRIKSPRGNYIPIPITSREFVSSKKSPTIATQRRGARLSSIFERSEIQRAKRYRKSRSVFGI